MKIRISLSASANDVTDSYIERLQAIASINCRCAKIVECDMNNARPGCARLAQANAREELASLGIENKTGPSIQGIVPGGCGSAHCASTAFSPVGERGVDGKYTATFINSSGTAASFVSYLKACGAKEVFTGKRGSEYLIGWDKPFVDVLEWKAAGRPKTKE